MIDTPAPDRDPALTDFAPDSEGITAGELAKITAFWIENLSERLAKVEALVEQARADPVPDFDEDWTAIEAHDSIIWSADRDLGVARLYILEKTGPDTFEPVPDSIAAEGAEGDSPGNTLWWRPYPPKSRSLSTIAIYNRGSEPRIVKVQGWYEERRANQ